MSDSYNVVFTGELLDGFELDSVERAFADIFKLSQTKVKSYFNGQSKLLKKDVSFDIAKKYKSRIESVGGKIEIKPVFKQASIENEIVLESNVGLNTKTGLTKGPQTTSQQTPVNAKVKRVTSRSKLEKKYSAETKINHAQDDSMNAIEIGRLNQIRKMQAIELAEDKNSKTLVVLGLVFLLLGIADLTLEFLNIYSLTGTFVISISLILVGFIFITSSKAS